MPEVPEMPIQVQEVAEDRLTRIVEAARIYYEARKQVGVRCNACKQEFSPETPLDSCPKCKIPWTTGGAHRGRGSVRTRGAVGAPTPLLEMMAPIPVYRRLTQQEVADLLSTPSHPISRSEAQRLLTE